MRLLYLAHDLDDPAVHRRVAQLSRGGAEIVLAGFRRGERPAGRVSGLAPIELGRTRDGRLGRRALSVARALILSPRWNEAGRDVDVVLARTIEMLALASVVRRRVAPDAALVYECLDIHRLMTARGLAGTALRAVEHRLLAGCALLVTSSPAFVQHYFQPVHRTLPPVLLLENKPLASEPGGMTARGAAPPEMPDAGGLAGTGTPGVGAPWRIGWFGVIRCRHSLALLAALVRTHPGLVEVEMRGRPARDVVPEFDEVVAQTPGLSFGGAYDRSDLARLYGRVQFTWAIDFYEEGANSAWLLPNRLYEGGLHGAVPLALRGVETGQWLARHGCGVLLDEPLGMQLAALFATLDRPRYEMMRAALDSLDRELLVETDAAGAAVVARLAALSSPRVAAGTAASSATVAA